MTDVLSELRRAEATITLYRDENRYEVVNGWLVAPLLRPYGDGIHEPVETHEPLTDDPAMVLSWSVLVEAVLPIIQDAILDIDKTAEPFRDHIAEQSWNEPALRLARFVNERTAS